MLGAGTGPGCLIIVCIVTLVRRFCCIAPAHAFLVVIAVPVPVPVAHHALVRHTPFLLPSANIRSILTTNFSHSGHRRALFHRHGLPYMGRFPAWPRVRFLRRARKQPPCLRRLRRRSTAQLPRPVAPHSSTGRPGTTSSDAVSFKGLDRIRTRPGHRCCFYRPDPHTPPAGGGCPSFGHRAFPPNPAQNSLPN